MADRLITCLDQQKWTIDAILPVPLHAEREADRGYNQAELLGRNLARSTQIRLEPEWLRRIRNTSQQASLASAERQRNVEGAFEASRDAQGLAVLLVDDVVTTGATLSACAAALRLAGANSVYAIAVSHA